MFNFGKKPQDNSENNIFPNPAEKIQLQDNKHGTAKKEKISDDNNNSLLNLIENLDDKLLITLADLIIPKLLMILEKKYDFQPTDKYKEEVSNRKKYLNQLDAYLQDRKNINQNVENELKQFLDNTTNSLTQSLAEFSKSINQRIRDAETKHGIEAVRGALLKNETIEQEE